MDSHPYSHETSIFTLGAPHVMRKCNDGFISTSNSEQEEQTNRENYDFYSIVSQIHINPEKKHEKTHHNDCLNLPTLFVCYHTTGDCAPVIIWASGSARRVTFTALPQSPPHLSALY